MGKVQKMTGKNEMMRRMGLAFAAATAAAVAVGEMKKADDPAIASETFAGKWLDADAPRSPLEKPGWTLTFNDDFDGVHLKDRNWYQSYRAGRKDWFRRMGIPSRFQDPDANYVVPWGQSRVPWGQSRPGRADRLANLKKSLGFL